MLVFLKIAFLDVVALLGVITALVPLMRRRRPLGRRVQPKRIAPDLPLEPRRRASAD